MSRNETQRSNIGIILDSRNEHSLPIIKNSHHPLFNSIFCLECLIFGTRLNIMLKVSVLNVLNCCHK